MNPHPLQPYWTEKARAAMREQRLSGRHLGKAPLGYMNVVVDGKPTIAVDPDTAPLVREAFRLAESEGMSVRKILVTITSMGLSPRSGKPMRSSALHKILSNPFYAGMVCYGDDLIAGIHEPMVSQHAFRETQRRLNGRRKHF